MCPHIAKHTSAMSATHNKCQDYLNKYKMNKFLRTLPINKHSSNLLLISSTPTVPRDVAADMPQNRQTAQGGSLAKGSGNQPGSKKGRHARRNFFGCRANLNPVL